MKDAIIVDIDGTAALGIGVHRKAYDYALVGKDKPNAAVFINIFSFWSLFPEGRVIFLSGRENVKFPGKSERKDKCYRRGVLDNREFDSCLSLTASWIHKYLEEIAKALGPEFLTKVEDGDYDWNIHMRKADDYRKDDEVKYEMYKEHVEDTHFIHYVLDDRNQVVDMWRKVGLTCFQVAPGDF